MDSGQAQGRAVRGDRADGQGVRQPAPARAARPARAGAAQRRRARAGERAVDRQHLPAPAGAPRRRAWSRARARARACATRSPARRCSRLWLALRDASAARLAEVERAARDYLGDDVEAIGREELIARLARATSCSSTCGPTEEFAAGHIEGARSIPLEELEQRLAELPADREIVAYCRGPFCAYAHEAVRRLRAEGRSARRLEDGWPEWRLCEPRPTRST